MRVISCLMGNIFNRKDKVKGTIRPGATEPIPSSNRVDKRRVKFADQSKLNTSASSNDKNIVVKDEESKRRKLQDFYTVGKKLGEGSYGKVRLAHAKKSSMEVAVKSILKKKVRRPESLIREISIMKEMQHDNIVRLYDVFEDDSYLHIVMELCTGGELFDHITEKKSFSEVEAARLMHQILDAVAYLHERNIAHRDLKPENFLFKERNNPKELKIIDFGLSRFYRTDTNMKTRVGTPYYISPEVLAKNYGLACDIWSVGVIMYILLCGYPPFWGDTEREIFHRIKKGEFDFPEEEWSFISADAKDLIQKMLNIDPTKRISAKEALKHPWFSNIDVVKQPLNNAVGNGDENKDFGNMLLKLEDFSKQNKLKRLALAVVARLMTEEEIKGLRGQFRQIDSDGNGTISVAELGQAMRNAGLHPTNEEVGRLLDKIDCDKNGKIDYTEFIAATMEEHLYFKDDILQRAFQYFDKDHTGKLTAENLAQSVGEDAGLMRKLIKPIDTDGNGVIDFQEFKKMMKYTSDPESEQEIVVHS